MLRKQEKNAVTRGVILAIGWGWGLDRFYEVTKKEEFSQSLAGELYSQVFFT